MPILSIDHPLGGIEQAAVQGRARAAIEALVDLAGVGSEGMRSRQ
jgi:hypothetical protein